MAGHSIASGSRVVLRTLESEDLAFKGRGVSEPALRIPMGNPIQSREQLSVPDSPDSEQFIVTLEAGPLLESLELDEERRIGLTSVSDGSEKRPEIGYWLLPAVHGHGLGTEAVSLLLSSVFSRYDAPTVGAQAFANNDASRALLESLGFEKEGQRRNFAFVDGEYRDLVCYGLDRSVWQSSTP